MSKEEEGEGERGEEGGGGAHRRRRAGNLKGGVRTGAARPQRGGSRRKNLKIKKNSECKIDAEAHKFTMTRSCSSWMCQAAS